MLMVNIGAVFFYEIKGLLLKDMNIGIATAGAYSIFSFVCLSPNIISRISFHINFCNHDNILMAG